MLRASPQKREEKERVRSALLRAALELGATHGFASLGLREVARAAEIAPTSFYRHFPDMAELGRVLVDEQVAPLLSELAKHVQAGDPAGSAKALVEALLSMVELYPEVIRFMVAERVGASAPLRAAIANKVGLLAVTLQPAATDRRSLSAESAVTLLLDGFARALDASEREPLRERLVEAISNTLRAP
jgi:TetR/AcrR family transcriptional regulator, fatty acid biosynthesis regulator